MNLYPRRAGRRLVGCAVALLLAGCMKSAPTRHYTLLALAPPRAAGPTSDCSLGVGPLRLPQHLRQAALVRRTGPYRVTYGDFDIWADPVEDQVVEVLIENLARLSGAPRVLRHPWRVGEAPDRQFSLEITAFELAAAGQAELAARWELRDAHGVRLDSGAGVWREPAAGQIETLAEALSRALLSLSQDLAAAAAR